MARLPPVVLPQPLHRSATPEFAGLTLAGTALLSAGKIAAGLLPAISITDTFVVASQAAMLALTAERGDVAIRSDLNKSFVLASDSPGTLGDWKELLTPTDAVLSVAGRTGAVTLAQADISGLTTASSVAFSKLGLGGATVGSDDLATAGSATINGILNVRPGLTNVNSIQFFSSVYFIGMTGATLKFGVPTGHNFLFQNNGAVTTALSPDGDGGIAFSAIGANTLDTWVTRSAAAITQLGRKNAIGQAKVDQTLQACGIVAGGADSNLAGGSLTIQSGPGVGNATPSALIFKSPVAVASGSGAQTQTELLKLFAGNIYMAALPTANPAIAGVLWNNSGVLTVSAG